MKKLLMVLLLVFGLSLPAMADNHYENYTIKYGDTIQKMVDNTLKSPKYLANLLQYNGINHPRQLHIGKVIKVPYSLSKNRYAKLTMILGSVQADGEVAKRNQILLKNSIVRTGAGSKAEIVLNEGSTVRVGPRTQFSLKKYAYNSQNRVTQLSLDRGSLNMRVTKLTGSSSFQVSTITTVAGVRGTEWFVSVEDDGSTSIAVYTGQVEFNHPVTGETLKVEPNTGYKITKDKQITKYDLPARIEWAE